MYNRYRNKFAEVKIAKNLTDYPKFTLLVIYYIHIWALWCIQQYLCAYLCSWYRYWYWLVLVLVSLLVLVLILVLASILLLILELLLELVSVLVWSGPGGPAAWRRSLAASSSSWAGRPAAVWPCWGSSRRWTRPPAPSASPRGRARSAARPEARRGARPCRQKKFCWCRSRSGKKNKVQQTNNDKQTRPDACARGSKSSNDRLCLHSSPSDTPPPPPHPDLSRRVVQSISSRNNLGSLIGSENTNSLRVCKSMLCGVKRRIADKKQNPSSAVCNTLRASHIPPSSQTVFLRVCLPV